MPLVRAFYCTPARAAELGETIEESYTLSRSEAKKLRNEYELMEDGRVWAVSVVVGVLGVAIKAGVAAIGFVLGTNTAISIAADYFEQLDNILDEIATGEPDFTNVNAVYEYRRHGSNDGAYYLSYLEIV